MRNFRWFMAGLGAIVLAGLRSDLASAQIGGPPPTPTTLWNYLGIPQGANRIRDARTNSDGSDPDAERTNPLTRIADPSNLNPSMPQSIQTAAKIKQQEDLVPQKIKAIKYLSTVGCGCYQKMGVREALMEALDDCNEQVRYTAACALAQVAGTCCDKCGNSCCNAKVMNKLKELADGSDDRCCQKETSPRVREAARAALNACKNRLPATNVTPSDTVKPNVGGFESTRDQIPPVPDPLAPQTTPANPGATPIPPTPNVVPTPAVPTPTPAAPTPTPAKKSTMDVPSEPPVVDPVQPPQPAGKLGFVPTTVNVIAAKASAVNTRTIEVQSALTAIETQPRVIETRPRAIDTRAGVVEVQPRVMEAQPRVIQAQPGMVEVRTRVIETQPRVDEAQPRVIEPQARMIESQPGMVEVQSRVINAQPIESKPIAVQSIENKPVDNKSILRISSVPEAPVRLRLVVGSDSSDASAPGVVETSSDGNR